MDKDYFQKGLLNMKKQTVAILLLLTVSLWMNVSTRSEIRQLRNQMSYMEQSLRQDINAISSNVYNAAKAMEEKAKWVRESDWELSGVNNDYTRFKAVLSFSLNERKEGEALEVVAVPESGGETVRVPVETEGLTCRAELDLENKDYEVELVGNDGSIARSERLALLPLSNVADRLVDIDGHITGTRFSSNSNAGTVDFFVTLNTIPMKSFKGMEKLLGAFEFVKVLADVYVGETLVETLDLTEGTGYEPKAIEEVSNAIPEFASEAGRMKALVYAGTWTFQGPLYEAYREQMASGASTSDELCLVVRAVDGKGNVYQGLVGAPWLYLEDGEIKSRR